MGKEAGKTFGCLAAGRLRALHALRCIMDPQDSNPVRTIIWTCFTTTCKPVFNRTSSEAPEGLRLRVTLS